MNWGAIQTISDSQWDQIPKGAPYPSRADATLLQGSGPQVYVMAGCQRHWIPDPDTFNAHGYNWSAIQHVSDVDLAAIPEGAQLQAQQPMTSDQAKQLLSQQQQAMQTLQQMLSQQQQVTEMMTNTIQKMNEVQQNIISNIR